MIRYQMIGASQIGRLWPLQTAYKAAVLEEAPEEADRERLALAMERREILFFGAWDEESLIGCCSVTIGFSTFNYLPAGVLEDFYIVPEYRHRGIARELVRFAKKESGAASLTVGCAECDAAMYRALGFTVTLGTMLAFDGD